MVMTLVERGEACDGSYIFRGQKPINLCVAAIRAIKGEIRFMTNRLDAD